MSVRRADVERAADVARSFSLRGVVTQETIGLAQQKARDVAAASPTNVPPTTNLKFSLGNKTVATPSAAPVAPKPTSMIAQRSATAPTPTNSVFKTTGPRNASSESGEIMRLTAYVDDLSKRLRETGSKLQSAELQLNRTN